MVGTRRTRREAKLIKGESLSEDAAQILSSNHKRAGTIRMKIRLIKINISVIMHMLLSDLDLTDQDGCVAGPFTQRCTYVAHVHVHVLCVS